MLKLRCSVTRKGWQGGQAASGSSQIADCIRRMYVSEIYMYVYLWICNMMYKWFILCGRYGSFSSLSFYHGLDMFLATRDALAINGSCQVFFTISGEKTWPAKHLYAVQHRCLRKECAVIKLTSHNGSDLNHSQFISVSQTTAHPRLFESSRRYFTTMFTLTLVKVPRAHGVQALPLLTTLKLLACRLACTSRLHGEWPQTWNTRISIMMINEYHT